MEDSVTKALEEHGPTFAQLADQHEQNIINTILKKNGKTVSSD